MRKIFFFVLACLAVINFASEEIDALFSQARSDRDSEKMSQIIQTLESRSDLNENSTLLTILADCYLEYGDWGVAKELKEKRVTGVSIYFDKSDLPRFIEKLKEVV